MNLRPYQEKSTDEIRDLFRAGKKRVILVSPTGSGKTVTFSFMTSRAIARGKRVVVMAHRAEILDQISRTLASVSVPHETLAAGMHPKPGAQVLVASVQTLARRIERMPAPDFVIVDECHHSAASQWSRVFATWSDSLFIGVTATPERLDGKGLGNYYEAMVRGPEVQALIDGGFLARPVYFAPQHIVDASTLRKTAGDYNKADAAELVDKPTITGDAVAQYRRHANGRTAIVFCISIDHAEHVAASFIASGIPAASIDGTMSGHARGEVLRRFAARKILVLTSCELVSEGFDLPAVGAAILLRPTASLAMHLQQVGRALRPKPDGSDAKILDHVGNCLRHGLAEDYREWSLDGFASKKTKAPPLEVAQCPKCFCMFRGATCPECGNEREMKGREIDTVAGELVEVSAEKLRAIAQRKAEERQCRTFEDFVALGKARGFKPGWAHFRWQNSWQRKAVAA